MDGIFLKHIAGEICNIHIYLNRKFRQRNSQRKFYQNALKESVTVGCHRYYVRILFKGKT